jgi:hypothetical protein
MGNTLKVEVRTSASDPSIPYRVSVEYAARWSVVFIDVNPTTVRASRGRPQRVYTVSNLAAAGELAEKIRVALTSAADTTDGGLSALPPPVDPTGFGF